MKKPSLVLFFSALLIALGASTGDAQRMQLTPEQRAQRLKDTLALNEDQYGKVLAIYQQMDKQRQELFSSGSDDRQARMQAMRSLADSTDAKIEVLLTPDQKTKYEDIKKQRMERGQNFRKRPPSE